ncbi:methylation domain protein [Cystobacter fuscus]|uniref:Methylation domain protein n=1 Tax=Cystobacter fuscus TaxID=43 RepID=A0A250J8K5_9BACT|nr:prepilin-type N-terminal cleavage/methylation domain-containing protein [Cystobacter fuscus]ATB39761.1 methylation domain protein [Cystobacter fuscus]
MKRRLPSPLGGFTLLELMVASSLSLIVLAAALWSAAELQRRGTFEESLMEAQNTLRAVREMLVVELQRAGMGVGSARMVFGRLGAADDVRYAINVSPEERFDGTGAFPADPTFAPPTGAYAGRISDVLQVWSWDSEAMNGANPIGMVPLTLCTHAANASDLYRSGNELCASTVPVGLMNRLVMVVKPETRIACIMRVTAVNQDASAPYARIVVSPGITEGQASNNNPCMSLAAGARPNDGTLDYWGADRSGGFILLMRGSAFRVNWRTGTPVLERRDISSVANPAATPDWVTLSHDVEMIRLRLGVMEDLKLPKSPVLWFPETTPERPHLEKCTDVKCGPLVPGGWTVDPINSPTARDALMSRVRMVQVQVITRTARLDSSLVRKDGAGEYILDADKHPQDGYKRRSSTLEIMPRNFALAGVLQ